MANSNPAFTRSPAFSSNQEIALRLPADMAPATTNTMTAEQLKNLYRAPSATTVDTDRMSYEDTVVKIVIAFVTLLAGAGVGWFVPVLAIPAAIAGFVLALVNIFRKKPSRALVLSYAAVEGIFVGGITVFFESRFSGIAFQAVLGTLIVVGVTLALFVSGKIRASKRATKIFLIAMIGYGLFSLVNVILIATGLSPDAFGMSGDFKIFGVPLGLIIGPLVIVMAAYSLVLDFESIKTGVQRGATRSYGWTAAFGIMVTVVWLYFEILRMLALSRR